MATYRYYQPGEVIFREGYHNHKVGPDDEGKYEKGTYELGGFLNETSDVVPNDHDLYFLDTTVSNGNNDGYSVGSYGKNTSGNTIKFNSSSKMKNRPVMVLYKGDKPVSVAYKYIAGAPKIEVKDYGLTFDSLFSLYI